MKLLVEMLMVGCFTALWILLTSLAIRSVLKCVDRSLVVFHGTARTIPAHSWVCRQCHAKNYGDNVPMEMDIENKERIRSASPTMDESFLRTAFWSVVPEELECNVCHYKQ